MARETPLFSVPQAIGEPAPSKSELAHPAGFSNWSGWISPNDPPQTSVVQRLQTSRVDARRARLAITRAPKPIRTHDDGSGMGRGSAPIDSETGFNPIVTR